jgi:hypothetical protein
MSASAPYGWDELIQREATVFPDFAGTHLPLINKFLAGRLSLEIRAA